jgi:daunorubicin resistance ABC transporter membrane protein
MTAIGYDIATARVLWRRDLARFWRQPSRIISALGQPVLFWLVIGSGLAGTFRIPDLNVGYMEYFFPGVIMLVLLFASIFASVSVIDDRHQGFLQGVLAGPGSRTALVWGKCLGSTSVALIQGGIFFALAPLAGFSLAEIDWPLLLAASVCTSLGLTALGFTVAWVLDSVQAYHAVQMMLLIPLWVVSGAMFPPGEGFFATVMRLNPVAYGVSAVRHALYGGLAHPQMTVSQAPWSEVGVVGAFAVVCVILASLVCTHRR